MAYLSPRQGAARAHRLNTPPGPTQPYLPRHYYTTFEHSKSSLYNWKEGSLWLVREQPEGACPQSRLRTIVHSEFGEETAHVTLDRLDRDD